MTIKRIVNGKEMEFALSDSELYMAHLEQENIFLRADVMEYLDTKMIDEEPDEYEHIAADYIQNHEDAFALMLRVYVKHRWELPNQDALDYGFTTACGQYEEEIENACE